MIDGVWPCTSSHSLSRSFSTGTEELAPKLLKPDTPVLLLRHDAVLVTGKTTLEAFDRIEVAEFSAQALLRSRALGSLQPIGEDDIRNLQQKFFPNP